MRPSLEGQVAIVTGAGGGIGAETAQALAEEGCKVAVWDLDGEKASAVVQSITDSGGEAMAVTGSVGQSDEVRRNVELVVERFRSVHILVNNAGFGDDAPLCEMTDEQWDRVLNVCLTAPFFCARAVAPYMIKQGYGRIVNIGSRTHLGEAGKANYTAAKAGVHGLTRTLAIELGVHAITVNTVAPGIIRTARVLAQSSYGEMNERAKARQLIKREGTPSDVVNGILFFASPSSGFITGDLLYVSGGRLS